MHRCADSKECLGKRDSNTHCLTMDVFAIFQLVGFDRRQACLHPAALKSCEKHLIGRCEQFNIRDFCRYKENAAENTCRIFKVFDAITAKISMLNQYGFGSRLPTETHMSIGDVAAALGYNDRFYFSTVFKKSTGSSPRAYRTRFS